MCLLVVKPRGEFPADIESLCKMATDSNPDGFGIAYRQRGEVKIVKGMHGVTQQIKAIERLGKREAILHWRFGTSGTRDENNCHPFSIPDGTAFAHNGVMPIRELPGLSDTHTVAVSVASADELEQCLASHASRGNKFAVMRPGEESIGIIGEEFGEWNSDGCWYSNSYWKTYRWERDELEEQIKELEQFYGLEALQDAVKRLLRKPFFLF